MHWCLAVIDLENKEIRYYDSMGGNNQKCLNALKEYLLEEHKGSPMDVMIGGRLIYRMFFASASVLLPIFLLLLTLLLIHLLPSLPGPAPRVDDANSTICV